MATGTKATKRRGKKISATTTAMRQDAITEMALANGARLDRGTFVVADMPNPHGEVMAGGKPVAHKTVKRQPQYELLRKRRVISDEMAEALAWYDDRRALAESGMIRNPLAGNGGGGEAGSGIPITEARMAAVRDVDWARHQITADLAPLTARLALWAFDAVMVDEVSFVEAGKRAKAYVLGRTTQKRQREELRDLFVLAATRLEQAYAAQFPKGKRRILRAEW